jgi:epoxide hydrolase
MIEPFTLAVPERDLEDLRARLRRTRWPEAETVDDWSQGVPLAYVRELCEYWATEYDWRRMEARLNAIGQFRTEIDGLGIHFLHARSRRADALPLILTHGWPGSVVEYLRAIEPLSRDFHVVIPSLPGYGFSGPTTEPGWDNLRIAKAWVELMSRLGFERFGVVGNDAGSMISPEVGRLAPERVVGVHVTQLFSFPTGDPAETEGLSEEEQAGMAVLKWFWEEKGAFNVIQSQQPQTLAHALSDSPAGLLGWLDQLLGEELDDDFVLTNTAIYWFTGTAGSSIRLYFENARSGHHASEPTTVPIALAMAEGDFKSIRRFCERDHKNIVSWKRLDPPAHGHYTAHTATETLTDDIRWFFTTLG